MATDEKMLEELYELLTLYFEYSPHGDFVKTSEKPRKTEPALNMVILREAILAYISRFIVGGDDHG